MSGKFVGVEVGTRLEFQVILSVTSPYAGKFHGRINHHVLSTQKYAEVPPGKIIYHVADQKTII